MQEPRTRLGMAFKAVRAVAVAVAVAVWRNVKKTTRIDRYVLFVHYMLWYSSYVAVITAGGLVLPKDASWYVEWPFWIVTWTVMNRFTPSEKRIRDVGSVRPATWLAVKGGLGILACTLASVVSFTLSTTNTSAAFGMMWPAANVVIAAFLFPGAVRDAREEIVREVLET